MRKLALIPTFLLLLFSLAPLAAQDATPQPGWPVEQRCVGDPTPPPDGWTWTGTIFTYNEDVGIRGLRADLSTAYHVTYEGDSIFNHAGSFSPDRKWFAVPVGETYLPRTLSPATSYYAINHIAIYSTNLARKVFTIPWQAGYEGYDIGIIGSIRWFDNEHLVYEKGRTDVYTFNEPQFQTYIFNPFTQEITTWVKPFNPLYASVAPDFSKVLSLEYDKAAQKNMWGIYDFASGELLATFKDLWRGLWSSDSSQLIAFLFHETPDQQNAHERTLAFLDLNGKPQDIIFQDTGDSTRLALSPDTHYVTFNRSGNLLLADVPKRHIYDLCFQNLSEPVWSPDNAYLALTNSSKILVFDIESWQLYELPFEIGDVVAWGAAD